MVKRQVRVLLVDSSSLVRRATGRFLDGLQGVEVVGCCASGQEALHSQRGQPADLALVALALPDMSGLVLAGRLKAASFPPMVVILSLADDPGYRETARAAGADEHLGLARLGQHLPALIARLQRAKETEPGLGRWANP